MIASGGLSTIADIERLAQHEVDGITGAIAGRAIYEGTLNFKEALKAARAADRGCAAEGRIQKPRLPPTGGGRRMGLAKRIIPLPRHRGRPRRQGRQLRRTCATPAIRSEVARRYDEQGADELAFLDIRASIEKRGLLLRHDRGGRRRRCSSR